MSESFFKALTIPKFKLPSFVASIGNALPQWPHALVLITGMNAVLKMKLLPQALLAALVISPLAFAQQAARRIPAVAFIAAGTLGHEDQVAPVDPDVVVE